MYIAVFGRKIKADWKERLELLLSSLKGKGARLCYYRSFTVLLQVEGVDVPEGKVFTSHEDLPEDVDLFLTIGGDGTFLTALSIVRDRDIPVAGVNFGRLGFLTAARVDRNGNDWIDALVKGDYRIDNKSILQLESPSLSPDLFPYCLNEMSIQRKTPAMLAIEVKLGDLTIPTYWADGLLIATPTGSTAYSLSVGGPIVVPGSNVFIIAPIAPHNLNVRPIIVPDDVRLEITIRSRQDAILSIDNRSVIISPEHPIYLSKAPFSMKAVAFEHSGFFEVLREKLLWGEDMRNNL